MNCDFAQYRKTVLDIIEKHKHKEIKNDTTNTLGGIYMLYVDNFNDDKVIPFYIGQTKNFQERHKQHLSEILALNKLDKSCYEYALTHELYNGRYRACKIFTYMVDHHCQLKDVRMIVLDEIYDEDERFEVEFEYIDDLRASIFGFNQLNCITKYKEFEAGTCSNDDYLAMVEADVEDLIQYKGFGYYEFNLFLATGVLNQQSAVAERLLNSQEYVKTLNEKHRITDLKLDIIKIRNYINNIPNSLIWDQCHNIISDYFTKNGLKSARKQELVLPILIYELEESKKELEQYFKRYIKKGTNELFNEINEICGEQIVEIRKKIEIKRNEMILLEEELENLKMSVYKLLLPQITYKSYPLKDLYSVKKLNNYLNEQNICYINVEYTCFRADYNYDFYPEISKIDYLIILGERVYEKSVFIKNGLEAFFETDELYYCESGFRSGPFNPFLKGEVYTHISVSMEYKNGINEYTLSQNIAEELCDIFEEIDKLIYNDTKVVYTTSGYKSTITRFTGMPRIEKLKLIKKLKSAVRKK